MEEVLTVNKVASCCWPVILAKDELPKTYIWKATNNVERSYNVEIIIARPTYLQDTFDDNFQWWVETNSEINKTTSKHA